MKIKMFILFLVFIYQLHFSLLARSNLRHLDELSDDIVIIHLNDVHCGVDDTIGYDGFTLYRDELKTKYKNVITVDVGDHIQGGTLGEISFGNAIIKIMNKVGFDVAVIGNHDFDYGIEQLNNLKENFENKYICANFCYRKNKTTVLPPYKIINANNKKIGFIGIVTPLALTKTYLSTIRDENKELIYDFLIGNNNQELYDKIQDYINKLKNEENVDYIILLAHIGMKKNEYKTEEIVSHLEGIDAVLDGHTHEVYNITIKDKNGNDIHINQVGTKLESIGALIIKPDGSISSEIITEVPKPENITNYITIKRSNKERYVDKNVNNFINSVWKEYENELNIQYGYTDFDFISRSEDGATYYCRYEECALGDLLADAIKTFGNGEITIINGGSVRNNIYKGNLTRGNLIDAVPWFNNIIVKRVTGQCILDALEFGVSKLPNGGLLQLSGITFDADISFNSSVVTDEKGYFVNVTGKRRVSNVKINGKDLVKDQLYNASLIEYNAFGGSGYNMFTNFEVFNEALVTDTDAICYFIKDNLNGSIPEIYKKPQGRINILNNTLSPSSSSSSESNPISEIFNFIKNLKLYLIISIIGIILLLFRI